MQYFYKKCRPPTTTKRLRPRPPPRPLIYDHQYDHHIWSAYMIIVYDQHTWSSSMIIIYDVHIKNNDFKVNLRSFTCTKFTNLPAIYLQFTCLLHAFYMLFTCFFEPIAIRGPCFFVCFFVHFLHEKTKHEKIRREKRRPWAPDAASVWKQSYSQNDKKRDPKTVMQCIFSERVKIGSRVYLWWGDP